MLSTKELNKLKLARVLNCGDLPYSITHLYRCTNCRHNQLLTEKNDKETMTSIQVGCEEYLKNNKKEFFYQCRVLECTQQHGLCVSFEKKG